MTDGLMRVSAVARVALAHILLLTPSTSVSAFAPVVQRSPWVARTHTPVPLRVGSPIRSQETEAVLVNRGTLSGAHVHAANALLSAFVNFWARLTGSSITPQYSAASRRSAKRSRDPVILHGTLCEWVREDDTGHEFWVCMCNVEDEKYTCRKTVKNGAWLWFCSKA